MISPLTLMVRQAHHERARDIARVEGTEGHPLRTGFDVGGSVDGFLLRFGQFVLSLLSLTKFVYSLTKGTAYLWQFADAKHNQNNNQDQCYFHRA